MKKLAVFGVVLSALLLSAAPTVRAIDTGNVGAQPANPQAANPRTKSIFIYQLKPGQTARDGIKIYNNTGVEQTISVYPVDSVLSSGGAFACAQAVDQKKDVGSWVTLDTSSVTLAPNSSTVVLFSVTLPATADVGEHDGCIALQAASQTATASDKSGVLLSFRSAIRMVVTVPGKIVKRLQVVHVTVDTTKGAGYTVATTIQNDGNVSLDTAVRVKTIALWGKTVTSKLEGTSPVLPHAKTALSYDSKGPFWGGLYRVRVEAAYNSNPTTELGVDQKANQVVRYADSAYFFVMPSPVALVVEALGLLVILAGLLWLIRRRKHHKQVRRHWVAYTVQDGDSLHKLAKRHNTSWKRIASVNHLKAPYDLQPDQKLKLPPIQKG